MTVLKKSLSQIVQSKQFSRLFGPFSLYFLTSLWAIRELNTVIFITFILTYGLTWFYRTAGAIASCCLALLAISISAPSPELFGTFSHVLFWISFCLSHFIMAFLFDNAESIEKAHGENIERQLDIITQEKRSIEAQIKEKEETVETLKLQDKKMKDDLKSFRLLAKTTSSEAAKIKEQNTRLLEEGLDYTREKEQFERLKVAHTELEEIAKKRLDELNKLRVEKAEEGGEEPQRELPTELLEELMGKKETAKQNYNEEIESLSVLHRELDKLMHQKDPMPLLFREVESAIDEKNSSLAQLREQIFGLEAELIKVKSGTDDPTPEGEYLATLYLECQRLEEENRRLMQMLKSALTTIG